MRAPTIRRRTRAASGPGLVLLLFLAGPPGASAEDANEDARRDPMEEIVVTASAGPAPHALSNSVSTFSSEEIEFLKYDNVTEVLRLVPGVHVEQPGSRGGRSSIYMRGLDPNQTVILVDGVRMGDPNNNLGGSFDLSTLDTDNIERIEVVRGPLSAVHGSDALAGAVQIITRRAGEEDEGVLDASGGRFGYHRELAIVRGRRGPVDLSLSGSWVDDGKPESDGSYRSGNLNGSFGVELPNDAELRANLRYVNARSRAYPEFSGGEEFAILRERDKRRSQELGLGLVFDQRLDEKLSYTAGVNYYRRREKRREPAIPPPPGNPFAAVPAQRANDLLYRTRLNANATWELPQGFSLTGGGDVTFENGNSVSTLDFGFVQLPGSYNDERVFGGPFLEGRFDGGFGLSVQAGVRADFSDEDDTQWTPRFGAAYELPWLPVTLRASGGRGFKLPAFFSKSDPVIGNDDLDSETSWGWDAGFDARLWQGRITLTATWFDIKVDDLIDFDASSFQLVNRDEVTSRGVEIGLVALLPADLRFSGSVTRAKTNIQGSGDRLRRRPRWRSSAELQWDPHERIQLGLSCIWVGSTYDESNPTGEVKLDDYYRFDFRSQLRVWREVSVYLAIDNLFDKNYEEQVGVPGMGIRPRAGVRAVF